MGRFNAHERKLIRELVKQNEKLEAIKDLLVMMLDRRQFAEYQEMIQAFEENEQNE